MTLQSITVSGITYRQQYRSCGRNCSRCPNHGPYWYAEWWDHGRARTKYVGAQLPAGLATPSTRQAAPPAYKPLTKSAAYKLLGLKRGVSYLAGQQRWLAQRISQSKLGAAGLQAVVQLDDAWRIVSEELE